MGSGCSEDSLLQVGAGGHPPAFPRLGAGRDGRRPVSFDQFLQYVFSGITSGSIYALTALGFTLIYNATDDHQLRPGRVGDARRA